MSLPDVDGEDDEFDDAHGPSHLTALAASPLPGDEAEGGLLLCPLVQFGVSSLQQDTSPMGWVINLIDFEGHVWVLPHARDLGPDWCMAVDPCPVVGVVDGNDE